MPELRRVPRAAWVILAVALALRIASVEVLTDHLAAGVDENAYLAMSNTIVDDGKFPPRPFVGGPSAIVPPAFPYTLAAIRSIVGGDPAAVARGLNVILSTVAVALIGWISWMLWRRRRVALAAMGIAAAYPPFLTLTAPLLTESWFLPLMLAAFAAALKQRESGGLRWALAAGIAAGFAALFKSAGTVIPVIVTLLMWPAPRRSRSSLAAPAVALVAAVVLIVPWTIRNAVALHAFVPVSTEVGYGFGGVYNQTTFDDPQNRWLPPHFDPQYGKAVNDRSIGEAEMTRELVSRSIDFVGEHPTYPAKVAYQNALDILALRTRGPITADAGFAGFGNSAAATGTFKITYRLDQLGFLVVLALALLALARGWARQVPRPLFAFAGLIVLGYLFMVSGMRFRVPADFVMILLAAPALATAIDRVRERAVERAGAVAPSPGAEPAARGEVKS